VSVTNEQRTQIRQSFTSVNVPSVTSVNFGVSVGTVIPETVTLVEVPAEIVRIVPAWRGYRVVKVRNQWIIVEPSTRKIVTVIEG
jgi:hypothetical protein